MIIVKSIELLCGGNNFANPSGLAVDKKNGLMYICDMNNRRIACFDFYSESIVTLGDLNRVNAEKRPKPLAVAFDNNRNLLMTDCENNLLWRFKSCLLYTSRCV